jgi:hypothetical protein
MKKGLFMLTAFVATAILLYMATNFIWTDLDFSKWSPSDRGLWLFLMVLFSALGSAVSSLAMWDWYYHLDDIKDN